MEQTPTQILKYPAEGTEQHVFFWQVNLAPFQDSRYVINNWSQEAEQHFQQQEDGELHSFVHLLRHVRFAYSADEILAPPCGRVDFQRLSRMLLFRGQTPLWRLWSMSPCTS